MKALEDIDNIIALIKKSESAAVAKVKLIEKYNFTENQAKAILDMKLAKLANLEKIELQKEQDELIELIKKFNDIICSPITQKAELKSRLQTIVSKFGDTRRTELMQIDIKPEEKEIIEVTPEDCVVIISKTGDIKRVPSKSFKVQNRNGKGVKSEDDAVLDTISTNTIDTLMVFTNKGKMYRLLVDNVPVGTNASKGSKISSLINMEPDEVVSAITSLYRETNAEYVVFFTKKGLIKKTCLSEYTKVKRSTGIIAINIKENDAIANVTFLKDEPVIVVTKNGMAIHFTTKDISVIGRATAGVRSIKLSDGDEVLMGLPIHNPKDQLAIFSELGLGKKVNLQEIAIQGRGGKGLSVYKPSSSTGEVTGVALISDNDNLLLIGKPNSICISAKDVPEYSRVSMGNMMVKDFFIKILYNNYIKEGKI